MEPYREGGESGEPRAWFAKTPWPLTAGFREGFIKKGKATCGKPSLGNLDEDCTLPSHSHLQSAWSYVCVPVTIPSGV